MIPESIQTMVRELKEAGIKFGVVWGRFVRCKRGECPIIAYFWLKTGVRSSNYLAPYLDVGMNKNEQQLVINAADWQLEGAALAVPEIRRYLVDNLCSRTISPAVKT